MADDPTEDGRRRERTNGRSEERGIREWFNLAWMFVFWSTLATAALFGAIYTNGVLRFLCAVAAVVFFAVLLYCILVLTIGGAFFRAFAERLDKGTRGH